MQHDARGGAKVVGEAGALVGGERRRVGREFCVARGVDKEATGGKRSTEICRKRKGQVLLQTVVEGRATIRASVGGIENDDIAVCGRTLRPRHRRGEQEAEHKAPGGLGRDWLQDGEESQVSVPFPSGTVFEESMREDNKKGSTSGHAAFDAASAGHSMPAVRVTRATSRGQRRGDGRSASRREREAGHRRCRE